MRRAALVPLAALAIAACGDAGEQLVAIASPEGVAAAAEASVEAGTSTVVFEATIDASAAGLDEPIVLRGTGARGTRRDRSCSAPPDVCRQHERRSRGRRWGPPAPIWSG